MRKFRLLYLLMLVAASLLFSETALADTWNQLSPTLAGKLISEVAVEPGSSTSLATIAASQVYTSLDGGILWTQQPIAYPTSLAYDTTYPGRLYVGSNFTCLHVHDDPFSTWREVDLPDTNSCTVARMVATRDGLYFFNNDANGTHGVYLYGRDNAVHRLASFPNSQPQSIAADAEGNIVIGCATDLYRTTDQGTTWTHIADVTNVGGDTEKVAVEGNTIWTVSANQYFFSPDNGATWQAKGIKRFDGSYSYPLAFDGRLYFGYQNNNSGAADVVTDNTGAPTSKLGLGQMAYSLARLGNSMLAGSYDGLYIDRGVLPSRAQIRRPVIVIPGILGSWSKRVFGDKLLLDPLGRTYDKLLDRLRSVGYSESNHTLYPFPYQWRQPNEVSAYDLKIFIQKVRSECGCNQVDIVAHSMGGLVAREYIEGPDYNNDINKLIQLGTPNEGSVNAYYTWEGGKFYSADGSIKSKISTNVVSAILNTESYFAGNHGLAAYARTYVKSLQQLLPDHSYIRGREYPDGYPRNVFLEKINEPAKIALLKQRVKLRVIGSESKNTLVGLTVGTPNPGKNWEDGEPTENIIGLGDGTVPYLSLDGLNQTDWLSLGTSHKDLPTAAKDIVVYYLLEDDPDSTYLASIPNQSALEAIANTPVPEASAYRMIYAPAGHTLSVTDSDGNTTSISAEGIPGSTYLGSASEAQFIILRDPPTNVLNITSVDTGRSGIPYPVGIITIDDNDGQPATEVTITDGDLGSVHLIFNPTNKTITNTDSPLPTPLPIIDPVINIIAPIINLPVLPPGFMVGVPENGVSADTEHIEAILAPIIDLPIAKTIAIQTAIALKTEFTPEITANVGDIIPSSPVVLGAATVQPILPTHVQIKAPRSLTPSKLLTFALAAFAIALAIWFTNLRKL